MVVCDSLTDLGQLEPKFGPNGDAKRRREGDNDVFWSIINQLKVRDERNYDL